MWRQLFEVTVMNLRQLRFRLGSSAVVVVGIAGVAAVLVALLAMAAGLQATLGRTGAPDRAIVLRAGTDSEAASRIAVDELGILATLPQAVEAAAHLVVAADLPKRRSGVDANVALRGVGSAALAIHGEIRLVRGRLFEPGRNEIVAGRSAALEFDGVDIGGSVRIRDAEWTVVGVFEAEGSAYESELWGDLATIRSAFRRDGWVSSVRVRVARPEQIDDLARHVEEDPRLDLAAQSERSYFARQSAGLVRTITTFGRAVAVIMAVGAALAALNAMHTAISARAVEVATLRALGFGTVAIVGSVMAESLALAALGGLLGGAIAYLGFDGFTASALSGESNLQVAFDFAVTPALLGEGLFWAMALGAIGGIVPALRAAKAPIAAALRG